MICDLSSALAFCRAFKSGANKQREIGGSTTQWCDSSCVLNVAL